MATERKKQICYFKFKVKEHLEKAMMAAFIASNCINLMVYNYFAKYECCHGFTITTFK